MATCKDCAHYNLCNITQIDYQPKNTIQHIEEYCRQFKDPSRLVYLPCKQGDLVYFIKARRVMADIVSKFTIDRCGVMLQRVNGYNLGYTDQLGKRIFLTREEAEQALAKQNQLDNTPQ